MVKEEIRRYRGAAENDRRRALLTGRGVNRNLLHVVNAIPFFDPADFFGPEKKASNQTSRPSTLAANEWSEKMAV